MDFSHVDWERLGIISFLVLTIFGALKGWWVPGYIFTKVQEEREVSERMAREAITLSERLTNKWVPPSHSSRSLPPQPIKEGPES